MKSIIFFLLIFSVFIISCSAISSLGGVSGKEFKEVTISSIYDTYDTNQIRGEKLYDEQYLRIEGYVFSIGSNDLDDSPMLRLQENPPKSFLGISIDTGHTVEAKFRDSESDDVALLSLGDKVIVECRGQGFDKEWKSLAITQAEFWLDQCQLYQ